MPFLFGFDYFLPVFYFFCKSQAFSREIKPLSLLLKAGVNEYIKILGKNLSIEKRLPALFSFTWLLYLPACLEWECKTRKI